MNFIATITIILFLFFFFAFIRSCVSTPYNSKVLRDLKKGSVFYFNCNPYIKHVFDRTVNKYICFSDNEVVFMSGNTIVCTDRGCR